MTTTAANHSTRRLLVALAVTAGLVVLVTLLPGLSHALLVVFAAILMAVFLDGLSRFPDRLHLPHPLSLVAVSLLLLVVVIAFAIFIAPPVAEQIGQLGGRITQGMQRIKDWLERYPLGELLLRTMPPPEQALPSASQVLGRLTDVFSTALGAITNAILVLLIGFYLAFQAPLYSNSIVGLLPPRRRARGQEVLAALSHALRWWLIGRITAMVIVGVLTALALTFIDIPLALALGFIAGVLAFIPYLGPILSVIPAVLIALVESPASALYVIIIYAGVQFIESNFITPIVQQHAVNMPPATLLIAQFLMGVLFGLIGILLATPLAVVVIILTQMLYLEGVYGDDVKVLGQGDRSAD